jgi:hypothetical protein
MIPGTRVVSHTYDSTRFAERTSSIEWCTLRTLAKTHNSHGGEAQPRTACIAREFRDEPAMKQARLPF